MQQGADSCAPTDSIQYLEVTLDDAGGGHYVVLKTDRWAIDPDQLIDFAKYLKKLCEQGDKSFDEVMGSEDFPGSDKLLGGLGA